MTASLLGALLFCNLSQLNPAVPVIDRVSKPEVSAFSFASILQVSDTAPGKGKKL
ncbi:MAG: hypothetical protein ACKOS8_02865 [Gemmataceae bacterium]